MSTDTQALEYIITQVQQLSPDDRLRLIQRVAETLLPDAQIRPPQRLEYGKYKGERMSTEEDFLLAEWHPTEEELDGS